MLFRGRTGGKSRERRGEVFVPVLKAEVCISGWEEEDNSPLWLLSIVPLRHLLRHDRGTLSQHIQYSVVHVTCTPVCMVFCRSGSGTMKTLCTCWFSFTRTHNGGQVMVVSQHAFCLWMEPWAGVSLRACQGGWMFPHLSLSDLMWQRASSAWGSLRDWFSLCPRARGCVLCLWLEDQTSSQLTHQLNHVMEHRIHSGKYLPLLLKIHLQGM